MTTPRKRKDPAAVALGRKGGNARMLTMTAAQRTAIARKAGLARQSKRRDGLVTTHK